MTKTLVNTTDLMSQEWAFLQPYMNGRDYDWFTYSSHSETNLPLKGVMRRARRLRACVGAARRVRDAPHPILISHLPNMAALTNIARRSLASHVPQIAFSFNFTDLPQGARRKVYELALRDIDEFVVFSSYESELYAAHLGVPKDRIKLLKWAMEAPTPAPYADVTPDEPYICAIGGEARDYALLAEVMRRLPHRRAVIVARPYSVAGIDLPENVMLHINLPAPKTWRLAVDSVGMVLPLRAHDTTCGHITFVAAQLLGLPLVVTDCLGLSDYITPETVFRAVPPKDLDALTAATEELFQQQETARAVAIHGQSFAKTAYSLENWVAYLRDASDRLSHTHKK